MSEEEVIQYLVSTPDFFVRNAEILDDLTIPHPVNGRAISLLEYQVDHMRKSTAQYRSQFERLVEVARENESTMQKSRRLILAGLNCRSLDDLAVAVDDMVRDDFEVSFHTLLLFGEHPDSAVRSLSLNEADNRIPFTIKMTDCYCGILPAAEMAYLLDDHAELIQSVAVLPLLSRAGGELKKRGVLVLGSEKATAFDKDKGTFFLQHLADLLSALLLRLVP
ncbi:DUF484 family protein [Marinomonas sp. THO17]|uniref:DUF484 family protein n=1 Tax=Marinomonas sp. THO17 TaxID=3149048 RepID=UPI00336C182D